jgi:hypothetical protein
MRFDAPLLVAVGWSAAPHDIDGADVLNYGAADL